jgi:hypothetical protein
MLFEDPVEDSFIFVIFILMLDITYPKEVIFAGRNSFRNKSKKIIIPVGY